MRNKRGKLFPGWILLVTFFSLVTPLRADALPEDLMKQYSPTSLNTKAPASTDERVSVNPVAANVPTGSLSGSAPLSQPPAQEKKTPVTSVTAPKTQVTGPAKFSSATAIGSVMLDTSGNVLRKPTASFMARVDSASPGTQVRVTLKRGGASTDEKPITLFLTLMGQGLSSTGSGQYSGFVVLPVSQDRKYQYSVTFEMLDAQGKPVSGVPAKVVPLYIRPQYFDGGGNDGNNNQNQRPTISGFSVTGVGESNAALVKASIANLPQGVSSKIFYQKKGDPQSVQSVGVSGASITKILSGLTEDTDYEFWIEVPNGSDVVKSNVVTFRVPKKPEEVKILSVGEKVENATVTFKVTLSKETNYVNVVYQEKLAGGQLGPKKTVQMKILGNGNYELTLKEPAVKAGVEYEYYVVTQSGNKLVQSAKRSFKLGQNPPFVQPTIKTFEVIKNPTNRRIVTIKANFNDMPSNAIIRVIAVPKGTTIRVDADGNYILPSGGVQSSSRPVSAVNPNFFGLSGIQPGMDYVFLFVSDNFYEINGEKHRLKVYDERFTFRT